MSIVKSAFVALMLISAIGLSVQAKTQKQQVTFTSAIGVNGTTVKSGTYEITYNDETGELSIVKGKNVIVRTMVHTEERKDKARAATVRTTEKGMERELVGVAFGGSRQELIIGQQSMMSGGNN